MATNKSNIATVQPLGFVPGTGEGNTVLNFAPINAYVGSYMQSLYGWSNNSIFYANVAGAMQPFYRMVQNWEQWCTGVVPMFHDFASGVVPTLLAQTVVRKCADLIYGGGCMFEKAGGDADTPEEIKEDKKDALAYISNEFVPGSGFKKTLSDGLYMMCELGTSLVKLNESGGGLWTEAVPLSRFYTSMDAKGEPDAVSIYLRPYEVSKGGPGSEDGQFILVEERFWHTVSGIRRPYQCFRVYRSGSMVNQFSAESGVSVPWEQLPYRVKESIKSSYGKIIIGKVMPLPFRDLGVYLLRFTPSVSKMPWLKMGDSAISRCVEDLCKYDILSAQIMTEMYVSRARVVADKSVQNPAVKGFNANTGIDSYIFTERESYGSTDKSPLTVMQPDIRAEQMKSLRNIILENIATSIGISPSSFAPYLQDNSNRTAREVSAEESATALFVENKRDLISEPINAMLKTVLLYKGFTDDVVIQFSKAGQTNYTLLVENVARAKSAGLMSLERSVAMINPEMDHSQVTEEVIRIREEEAQKQSLGMPDFDFGGAI
jgi:hypothetical protein